LVGQTTATTTNPKQADEGLCAHGAQGALSQWSSCLLSHNPNKGENRVAEALTISPNQGSNEEAVAQV
jgi:hypothetical protein